jgi:ACS family pantothenate transporter-like MFS transporter
LYHRWLFVIDGVWTVPVAIAGFLFFPGVPDSPRPFYLSEYDISLAIERRNKANIRKAGKLDLDVFKRTLSRWHIWVFVACYMYVARQTVSCDTDQC